MNERTRTGLEILLAALVIGLMGNLLLRQVPWGVNAFLFVTAFTTAMVVLMARFRPELLTIRTLALQGAMVFFASMFLIRDSIEIRTYDTFAIIIIMGVLVLPNFGLNQRISGVFHYALGFLWSGINSVFGSFLLLGADIEWKAMPGNRLSKSIFSVLRGVAIALPLLLIFGALFMAADAAFENFANNVVNFKIDEIVSHVMLTAFLSWLVAGYFRGSLVDHLVNAGAATAKAAVSPIPDSNDVPKTEVKVSTAPDIVQNLSADTENETGPLPDNATILEHINRSDPPNAPEIKTEETKPATESEPAKPATANAEPKKPDWQNWDNTRFPQAFTLGTVETVIILGLVNVLFISFVLFQLPYLFGGMDLVQATPDLKLADFARRGFGELVAVAFLVLPMLLASHWLLRRDNARNEIIFRVFAGVQVGLLFVIMASAMQRLILLTGEVGYGWTTIRFYPMVFMIWLAVVFAWFAMTVLRGKRNNFAWGALWSAIVILGVTNLMSPDDFIARKNLQLMQQGREYDSYYNANLSDDAIPVIFQHLDTMSNSDRCQTLQKLYWRLNEARSISNNEGDWRSFNFSRERTYQLLEDNAGLLVNGNGCENYSPLQYQRISFSH